MTALPGTLVAKLYDARRCAVIHPGFTETAMLWMLGDEYIQQQILLQTQLNDRQPVCFMIFDSAMSGEHWVDAGSHPQT